MDRRRPKPNKFKIMEKQEVSASNAAETTQETERRTGHDDKAAHDGNTQDTGNQQSQTHHNPDYCILPECEKIALMLTASFAAIISPISSSIYLPAVNVLSRDLNVSISLVNVTISTYLVSAADLFATGELL